MACKGIYIHVPFCERKCPYCDFYSVAADAQIMDAYLAALLRALDALPYPISAADTVYFGGGTPSLWGGARIGAVLEKIAARCGIAADAEITVECNPHSALAGELRFMRAAGVNRLSFGMQSADDRQLRLLGRLHTVNGVESAVETAQKCGISHISLDMMLATPGQSCADIDRAAALCAALGAEHVSAYLLKIEEATPFFQNGVAALCPDDDGQADAYLHAVDALERLGYQQYEISNFARDGHVARHNLKYWNDEEYVGIGPSAHSFAGGRRFYFPRNLQEFLHTRDAWALAVDDGEGGGPEEYVMLRARLREGIPWAELSARYPGYDAGALREKARPMERGGLVVVDHAGLRLTVKGFLLSNAVIGELLA